ncbi:MAG: PQQ-dependent sugar dehydrogenase [Saprospiraceae bacterium]|nr:PQQ-dependent sugar dehydrogenase [Saprospiraceae bacterium]
MKRSHGGGQTNVPTQRNINAADIALPAGYRIEAVATDLTFPSGITFDEQDRPYIVEAGYSYGEVWTEPRLLRLESGNKLTTIATGAKNGPWTGVEFYKGDFYVAEGGQTEGGKILRIDKDGKFTTLIKDLPSLGDHHTNGPAIHDGYLYFGIGTATNSGVVGLDNEDFGWLKRHPDFHDVPCGDVTLSGQNYFSDNPTTPQTGDRATTGAYVPFGQATLQGQVIHGQLPCSGAILRIPITGGAPELVAWGLRNPFGLCFSPDGRLFVSDNAFDERGSRPVWGSGDVLWEIKTGAWYGWPDYSAGVAVNSDVEFKPPGQARPKALLLKKPGEVPTPAAVLGVHASANGLDFSRSDHFGYQAEAFIALFGDMAPGAGKVLSPVGFKVQRVDVKTGIIQDFAANKGRKNGPATWLKKGGLERPVAVRFNRSGDALYVVDFGIMQMGKAGPLPLQKTGVIWKITKI